jgi:hypothetical protein
MRINNRNLQVNLIELENAMIFFVFENVERLGTVAIALPRIGIEGSGPASILVGASYQTVSKILAEKVASKFNKISLVSVYTSLPESMVLKTSIDLLEKF